MASRHTMLFVGGLHRSGTTLLASLLGTHPGISGFDRTGAPEGEGQYLQTVCPVDEHHGGPGRFAFDPDAHLTEVSPLAAPGPARRLREQWNRYWDLSCPVLLEKSPPNLLRFRYLQRVFPGARFVLMTRHPVPVSLSTRKWAPALGVEHLLDHWLHAHRIAHADMRHLDHALTVRYEDLIASPAEVLKTVGRFVGLEPAFAPADVDRRRNPEYFEQWRRLLAAGSLDADLAVYESRVRDHGYDLRAGAGVAVP